MESGSVHVGTPYPAFFRKLSRLMAAFSKRYPGIHIALLEGMSTELAERGIEPNVRLSCRDTHAVYHMVEAGLGVTLDNAIFAAQFQSGTVRALPLRPEHRISIGVATPRPELLSPAAKRFIEQSKEFFPPAVRLLRP